MQLGDRVRDSISRLSGVVIGRTEWLYGCVRLTVQPEEHVNLLKTPAALVEQAEAASARMALDNPNRLLLLRLSGMVTLLETKCTELIARNRQLVAASADRPRIVLP